MPVRLIAVLRVLIGAMPGQLGQIPRAAVVAGEDDLGLAYGLDMVAQWLVVLAGAAGGEGGVPAGAVALLRRVPLHQWRTADGARGALGRGQQAGGAGVR